MKIQRRPWLWLVAVSTAVIFLILPNGSAASGQPYGFKAPTTIGDPDAPGGAKNIRGGVGYGVMIPVRVGSISFMIRLSPRMTIQITIPPSMNPSVIP